MNRKITLLSVALLFFIASCASQKTAAPPPTETASLEPVPSYLEKHQQALSCVMEQLPAESYMTNEYLPTEPVKAPSDKPPQSYEVRLGLSWVLNDEHAPFYNAQELGYFEEEGLEVELVPGGPGIDHLLSLGGGAVDVAVTSSGSFIPRAITSTTPIDMVAVGTILKNLPFVMITATEDLVALDRELDPRDLVGRRVGLQAGGAEYFNWILLDKYGIPRDQISVVEVGYGPDALLLEPPQVDFYPGWIMNQPRALDAAGVEWKALWFNQFAFDEPVQVIAVRRETLASPEGQEMVRRLLRATYRGLEYLLDHPEESAEIAVKYAGEEGQFTKEQAMWRFEHQQDLIVGNDNLGLMRMDSEKWNDLVASLVRYGEIELPGCESLE